MIFFVIINEYNCGYTTIGVLLLFGYIRPFKPHLRMCEYDTYKAIYCGLCKELGSNFSFPSRFTLSYDFAFLGLLSFAINENDAKIDLQSCIAHPLKKTPCLVCDGGLTYTAAAAAISVYHKLKDDMMDKGFKKKAMALLILPFVTGAYKKAKKLYPSLALIIEEKMKLQIALEKEHCASIDNAAEPTAQIMSEIAKQLSKDEDQQRVLARFGYLLGRYVYITDALDDVKDDFKKKDYNPLITQNNCQELDMDQIKSFAKDSVFFTLGELANVYALLNIEKFKPILDNIIFIGLRNTFTLVLNEKEILK